MTQTSKNYGYFFAFAVCIGLTAFYSFYKLAESPPTWFDEGIYVQVAQSLVLHGVQAIQTAPHTLASTSHVTVGYPLFAFVALSLKLCGNSLFAARVPMALFIIFCVLATWLAIYKMYGPRAALLSLFLLSTFPLLYGNGKNVLGEVPGMFYVLLALYFLWQIERHQYRGTKWYALAGLFVGLASATKPIFFLLPVAIGIVFLCKIRRTPWRWQDVFVGAALCLLPLLLWVYMQFGNGDFISSILSYYVQGPYAGEPLLPTIVKNMLRFFTEATPLYCAVLVGMWAFSLAIRVYRTQAVFFAEWAAFVFSILVLLSYLRLEGWYRYFFEAMMLALIFLPVSLHTIAKELERHVTRAKVGWLAILPIVLLAAIQFYQLNYSSWVADHYDSTQTALFEAYFASHAEVGSVFVYNAPEIVPFLRTTDYYQYFDIDPSGALAYGKENVALLQEGAFDEVLTSSDMYLAHTDLFYHYSKKDTINGYVVLSKP